MNLHFGGLVGYSIVWLVRGVDDKWVAGGRHQVSGNGR